MKTKIPKRQFDSLNYIQNKLEKHQNNRTQYYISNKKYHSLTEVYQAFDEAMQRSLDTPYNYYNSENIETDKRKTAEIITNEQKIRNYIKTYDNITQRKTGRSFLNEQYCKLQTGPQCMKIDAQGHDVTDYEVHAFCGGCGKDFGAGSAGAQAALEHTMMDFNDGCSNYYADEIAVGSHWEETSPAYDECSICGKR